MLCHVAFPCPSCSPPGSRLVAFPPVPPPRSCRTEGREKVEAGFMPFSSFSLAFFCSYSFATNIPLAHKAVCSPVSNYLQVQYHNFICFSDISSLAFHPPLNCTTQNRTSSFFFLSSLQNSYHFDSSHLPYLFSPEVEIYLSLSNQ